MAMSKVVVQWSRVHTHKLTPTFVILRCCCQVTSGLAAACSRLPGGGFPANHERPLDAPLITVCVLVKEMGARIAHKVMQAWNFPQMFTRTYFTILEQEPPRVLCCIAMVARQSIFLSNRQQRCSFWTTMRCYDFVLLFIFLYSLLKWFKRLWYSNKCDNLHFCC